MQHLDEQQSPSDNLGRRGRLPPAGPITSADREAAKRAVLAGLDAPAMFAAVFGVLPSSAAEIIAACKGPGAHHTGHLSPEAIARRVEMRSVHLRTLDGVFKAHPKLRGQGLARGSQR